MAALLPFVYFAVLLLEAVVLAGVYSAVQPASGSIFNVAIGSIALASMIVMLIYSVARRSQFMRNAARLSTWLHLHIFLGLQGVLLAVFHCVPLLYRDGWPILVNPGMLNLYAVIVVFGSGLFGRYLFAQVPRTLGGQHMAANDVDAELAALGSVPQAVTALWANAPQPRSMIGVFAAAGHRRSALRALGGMELPADVRALAMRRVVLEHQKATILYAQRLFRLWIVLHRPVAAAMYLLSFVHIALSVMFSPSWEWF